MNGSIELEDIRVIDGSHAENAVKTIIAQNKWPGKDEESIVFRMPGVKHEAFLKIEEGVLPIAFIRDYEWTASEFDKEIVSHYIVSVKPDKSLVVSPSTNEPCHNCNATGTVEAFCSHYSCNGHDVDCCICDGTGIIASDEPVPFDPQATSKATMELLASIYQEIIGNQMLLF